MTDYVFAVFRVGVYRHECGGVFSDKDSAASVAKRLAETDCDDYHTYEVVRFPLDVPSAVERGGMLSKGIIEESPLATFRKVQTS